MIDHNFGLVVCTREYLYNESNLRDRENLAGDRDCAERLIYVLVLENNENI